MANNQTENVIRGIGITAVVMGHIGDFYPWPHVYFWHIPLFFFLAGNGLVKPRPFLKTVQHVVVNVWGYVALWTGIYAAALVLLGPAFYEGYFSGNLTWWTVSTGILESSSHEVGLLAPLWFLTAYGTGVLVASVIGRMTSRVPLLSAAVGMVMIVAGWNWGGADEPAKTWQVLFVCRGAIATGYMLVGLEFYRSARADALVKSWLAPVVFGALAFWLLSAFALRPSNMAWAHSESPVIAVTAVSLCCIAVVLWAGRVLENSSLLATLGAASKAIMTHHLLAFALVNASLLFVGVIDRAQMHPYLIINPHLSWPVYLAAGTLLPLAVHYGLRSVASVPHQLARRMRRSPPKPV